MSKLFCECHGIAQFTIFNQTYKRKIYYISSMSNQTEKRRSWGKSQSIENKTKIKLFFHKISF